MWTRWVLCFLFVLHCGGTPAFAFESPRRVEVSAGEVAAGQLPAEARATLSAIRRGGPFAYDKDGTTFFNREGLLPKRPRGYYTEYTVPTPGARDRGARRIVAGGDPRASGEYYYTPDHYRSFLRIRE